MQVMYINFSPTGEKSYTKSSVWVVRMDMKGLFATLQSGRYIFSYLWGRVVYGIAIVLFSARFKLISRGILIILSFNPNQPRATDKCVNLGHVTW